MGECGVFRESSEQRKGEGESSSTAWPCRRPPSATAARGCAQLEQREMPQRGRPPGGARESEEWVRGGGEVRGEEVVRGGFYSGVPPRPAMARGTEGSGEWES